MTEPLPGDAAKRLKRPLRLTLAGMVLERTAQAFWRFAALAMALAALLLSGVIALWPLWLGQGLIVVLALGAVIAFAIGLRRFRPALRSEALQRLDATLPGNPIATLTDHQAIGADDPESQAVWQAHRHRMADRLEGLRALPPRPGLARRDPFALRLIAATALAMALMFGTSLRQGDLAALMPGAEQAAIAQSSWEGWIEAPSYTGKPTLYLADQPPGALAVPVGARVTLRLYGRVGALAVTQSVAPDAPEPPQPEEATSRAFKVAKDGTLTIGDDSWQITAIPDAVPRVQPSGELVRTLAGEMRLPFSAHDDYGVSAGQARIVLDPGRADRRFGLARDPEPRADVVVDLPMPFRGDRREVAQELVENLAQHPWADLPVRITFTVTDAAGQSGDSAPVEIVLPGRRFLHPLAAALIEQRRDILWTKDNADRVARVLRAITNRGQGVFPAPAQVQAVRDSAVALEDPALSGDQRDAVAGALWDIAVEIEDGALADSLERLRRAQERLSEAMRQGATPQELRELMDEYRQAQRDFMRQLGRQQPENKTDEPDSGKNGMEMTQDDLAAMMDKLDELMQQGRMDEAQALLDQFQQMLENMKTTEGASGEPGQGQGDGEKSMQELADTLRSQRGLSDEAFRDLQEQLNPDARAGQSGENVGRDGGAGQGQSHGGDAAEQGQGEGQGQSGAQGQGNAQGKDGDQGQSLADRQQALERQLQRQRGAMPGEGTPEGEAAREALERAGRAMGEAADALRQGDTPGALDRQAEAMENLREGMRNLEDQMRREAQSRQQGGQGRLAGQPGTRQRPDPFGRNPGGSGATADSSPLEEREDVYRRAQDLMQELRRRSGEAERPEIERDYLKRLLDHF